MTAMEAKAYPVDLKSLFDIWQTFVTTGKLDSRQRARLDPTVLQSWRRCMPRLNPWATPRLNAAQGSALESVLRAQSELISVGTPIIEDIHQFVEGSNCAILLSDGSARIIATGGDQYAVRHIESLHLGLGSYWYEGQRGTNALGLVLANAMPVQVAGAEHYFELYHQFSTSAAPVHDIHGRIIGLLAIIGRAEHANTHTLALVMSAARAISNQLQADWSLQEANQRLNEVHAVMSTISEGVISWDDEGEINHVNNQAGMMLGINPAAIMGQPVDKVLNLPAVIHDAALNGRELRDIEVNIQINGHRARSIITLRPIIDAANVSGYILLLRPIEEVHQLVQKQAGSHASIRVDDVHGTSPAMRQVVRQIHIAARGLAPVLLQGEGGVGKNHIAQAIHNDSARAGKPFLAINCRAIPREIMSGELLGEENEERIRPSKFELAHGGTLLLDQLDSLSLEMQAALLQVIETGYIMRIGGIYPIPVDVRIIAATSAELQSQISDGSFLSHLFYRFGVFNIKIPPLRYRVEDIPLLVERIKKRIGKQDGKKIGIDEEAMAILYQYPWPGNVRELESVLERAILQCRNSIICPADLSETVRQGRALAGDSLNPLPLITLAEAEHEAILRAGWANNGRVVAMARDLKIGRTTLWRKMKRYNISPDQFKA